MVTSWSGAALFGALLLSSFPQLATGPAFAGETVVYESTAAPGTVIVRTSERRLYFILKGGLAVRYTVGVGRPGRQWVGTSFIHGKHIQPNWMPPSAVRLDRPNLPTVIAGGAPNNPMGAAALTIAGGDYAIHGTNAPKSIGGFVSYGCIRMLNQDITDLYARVRVGTTVVVTR
jgi:lipoprotein-anchoring transpeptidase ErfK/SrfK